MFEYIFREDKENWVPEDDLALPIPGDPNYQKFFVFAEDFYKLEHLFKNNFEIDSTGRIDTLYIREDEEEAPNKNIKLKFETSSENDLKAKLYNMSVITVVATDFSGTTVTPSILNNGATYHFDYFKVKYGSEVFGTGTILFANYNVQPVPSYNITTPDGNSSISAADILHEDIDIVLYTDSGGNKAVVLCQGIGVDYVTSWLAADPARGELHYVLIGAFEFGGVINDPSSWAFTWTGPISVEVENKTVGFNIGVLEGPVKIKDEEVPGPYYDLEIFKKRIAFSASTIGQAEISQSGILINPPELKYFAEPDNNVNVTEEGLYVSQFTISFGENEHIVAQYTDGVNLVPQQLYTPSGNYYKKINTATHDIDYDDNLDIILHIQPVGNSGLNAYSYIYIPSSKRAAYMDVINAAYNNGVSLGYSPGYIPNVFLSNGTGDSFDWNDQEGKFIVYLEDGNNAAEEFSKTIISADALESRDGIKRGMRFEVNKDNTDRMLLNLVGENIENARLSYLSEIDQYTISYYQNQGYTIDDESIVNPPEITRGQGEIESITYDGYYVSYTPMTFLDVVFPVVIFYPAVAPHISQVVGVAPESEELDRTFLHEDCLKYTDGGDDYLDNISMVFSVNESALDSPTHILYLTPERNLNTLIQEVKDSGAVVPGVIRKAFLYPGSPTEVDFDGDYQWNSSGLKVEETDTAFQLTRIESEYSKTIKKINGEEFQNSIASIDAGDIWDINLKYSAQQAVQSEVVDYDTLYPRDDANSVEHEYPFLIYNSGTNDYEFSYIPLSIGTLDITTTLFLYFDGMSMTPTMISDGAHGIIPEAQIDPTQDIDAYFVRNFEENNDSAMIMFMQPSVADTLLDHDEIKVGSIVWNSDSGTAFTVLGIIRSVFIRPDSETHDDYSFNLNGLNIVYPIQKIETDIVRATNIQYRKQQADTFGSSIHTWFNKTDTDKYEMRIFDGQKEFGALFRTTPLVTTKQITLVPSMAAFSGGSSLATMSGSLGAYHYMDMVEGSRSGFRMMRPLDYAGGDLVFRVKFFGKDSGMSMGDAYARFSLATHSYNVGDVFDPDGYNGGVSGVSVLTVPQGVNGTIYEYDLTITDSGDIDTILNATYLDFFIEREIEGSDTEITIGVVGVDVIYSV